MRLLLGGLAASGVVAAHLLAYLLTIPDPHHRALVLERTGHGNWSLVTSLTLGLLVAGLLSFVVGSVRDGGRRTGPGYRGVVLRLAALQVSGFILLEAAERLSGGDPLSGLISEPAVMIGIALQIAVALIGAFLLFLFERVIDRVIESLRPNERGTAPERSFPRTLDAVVRFAVGTGGGTLRGPPPILPA